MRNTIEGTARFTLKDGTGLSAEEVATLPMALATAVRAIKEIGNVKAGDKVLVQAGASLYRKGDGVLNLESSN